MFTTVYENSPRRHLRLSLCLNQFRMMPVINLGVSIDTVQNRVAIRSRKLFRCHFFQILWTFFGLQLAVFQMLRTISGMHCRTVRANTDRYDVLHLTYLLNPISIHTWIISKRFESNQMIAVTFIESRSGKKIPSGTEEEFWRWLDQKLPERNGNITAAASWGPVGVVILTGRWSKYLKFTYAAVTSSQTTMLTSAAGWRNTP